MGSAPASGAANGALAVRTCAYGSRGLDARTPFVRREARRTAAEGGCPPHRKTDTGPLYGSTPAKQMTYVERDERETPREDSHVKPLEERPFP